MEVKQQVCNVIVYTFLTVRGKKAAVIAFIMKSIEMIEHLPCVTKNLLVLHTMESHVFYLL